VERAGIGRRRIFIPSLSYGKRMPRYETDGARVTLRIFDGSFDERMASLVAKWKEQGRDIDLDGLLILSYLRERAFIDTRSASTLLQLPMDDARTVLDRFAQTTSGFLERRGKAKSVTYHLTKVVASDLLGKAAYTETKGVDSVRYPEMVRAFLRDHDSMTPKQCRELLRLGESATARVQVSRLLKEWSAPAGFLRREGKPPKVTYYLREDVNKC
jgi:ATP-dependent DNA helicase RecG